MNNLECDFVVSNEKQIDYLIQICYELNHDNLQRELNGLIEAMQDLHIEKGLILTLNQTDTITKNKIEVQVKPVWKWMLEK